ncbi:MAG TPA: hypothetical protein VMU93_02765 [Caulobacteraceae bacterium]|nr:hypothetical protein [Caulobacteraceae bacterium]
MIWQILAGCLLALVITGFTASRAAALPAFAVQTGEPCQGCHVGGFGPQLTPFGREFKLKGYTIRTNAFNLPLSAMAVASYIRSSKSLPPPVGFSSNDNFALDQVSLFFAGGFGQHLGAFIQTTYDGVANAFHWDNLDVRAVTTVRIRGADAVLGASINNSPTVQDAWNTLPAWGYPYTTSALAPSPSASPLLNGALAQTTLGVTGYAWIKSEVYIEAGAYGSPGPTALTRLGVDPLDPGDINGLAPYGRVALQKSVAAGTLEIGAFGMETNIFPGLDRTTGFTDHYTDLGLDGSYIRTFKNGDVLTANGRILHERQRLSATCALAGQNVGCASNSITDLRADGSYYWHNEIGATVAVFDTFGTGNSTIYSGNRTFKPDSSGVTVQVDGTPFGGAGSPLGPRFNMRVGVQYTAYAKFDGAGRNYDGLGRNAADNNTFRVFTWLAY